MPKIFKRFRLNEQGVLHLIPLFILLIGIVAGIYLIQHPQIFKPKASGEPIQLKGAAGKKDAQGNDCKVTNSNGTLQTNCDSIDLDISSPQDAGLSSDTGFQLIKTALDVVASPAYASHGPNHEDLYCGDVKKEIRTGSNTRVSYPTQVWQSKKYKEDFWIQLWSTINPRSQHELKENCSQKGPTWICQANSGDDQYTPSAKCVDLSAPEGEASEGDNSTGDQTITNTAQESAPDPDPKDSTSKICYFGSPRVYCYICGETRTEEVDCQTGRAITPAVNTPAVVATPAPASAACPAGSDREFPYNQCGGTDGLEDKDPTHLFEVTEVRDCNNKLKPYPPAVDKGVSDQCQKSAPAQGAIPAPVAPAAPAGDTTPAAGTDTTTPGAPSAQPPAAQAVVAFKVAESEQELISAQRRAYPQEKSFNYKFTTTNSSPKYIFVQFYDATGAIVKVNVGGIKRDYYVITQPIYFDAPAGDSTASTNLPGVLYVGELVVFPTSVKKDSSGSYSRIYITIRDANKSWQLYFQNKPGANCGGTCDLIGWTIFDTLKGSEGGTGSKGTTSFGWTPQSDISGIHTIALIDTQAGKIIKSVDVNFEDKSNSIRSNAQVSVSPNPVVKDSSGRYPVITITVKNADRSWTLFYNQEGCGNSCDPKVGWTPFSQLTTGGSGNAGAETSFTWAPYSYISGTHTFAIVDTNTNQIIAPINVSFYENSYIPQSNFDDD